MSAAKHAPGPWWVTDSGVRNAGGYICHTNKAQHYEGQDERYESETAERAANAHLIAAAPDLLAVTRDFEEALQELGLFCECGAADCRTTRLRAAIAKAAGEPSIECTCPAKDMPFGRCCKATGSAS